MRFVMRARICVSEASVTAQGTTRALPKRERKEAIGNIIGFEARECNEKASVLRQEDPIGKHGLEIWELQVAGSNPAAPTNPASGPQKSADFSIRDAHNRTGQAAAL
jgi:hypothetical protein